MLDIHQMIIDLEDMRANISLRDAVGDTKREIIAALIIANAIHKSTIQQINTYSAIQDLTSAIRDIIPLMVELKKDTPP